jgi:TetR/AcrR family transcriptional regulator, cholesterol catabolism regulator
MTMQSRMRAALSTQKPAREAPAAEPAPTDIRDLVSQLKRERILSAAIELFYSRGFTRTTLDDVAKALGMTKPFIYQHFKSKNAVLAEICSRAIKDAHQTLDRTLAQQGTAAEKLRIIVRDFILTVLNNQANAVIYSREETELSPKDRQKIIELRRDFDRRLVVLLEEGVAQGEFVMDDVRLTSLVIGSVVGWSPVWFRAGGRLTKEAAAAGVASLVLKMVGAKSV